MDNMLTFARQQQRRNVRWLEPVTAGATGYTSELMREQWLPR